MGETGFGFSHGWFWESSSDRDDGAPTAGNQRPPDNKQSQIQHKLVWVSVLFGCHNNSITDIRWSGSRLQAFERRQTLIRYGCADRTNRWRRVLPWSAEEWPAVWGTAKVPDVALFKSVILYFETIQMWILMFLPCWTSTSGFVCTQAVGSSVQALSGDLMDYLNIWHGWLLDVLNYFGCISKVKVTVPSCLSHAFKKKPAEFKECCL